MGIVRHKHFKSTLLHYSDVIMGAMASQITSLTIVYSTMFSRAGQEKHQSPVSLAFVRGIHWWPVNSLHKWPVTPKIFPFDDVIMDWIHIVKIYMPVMTYSRPTCPLVYFNKNRLVLTYKWHTHANLITIRMFLLCFCFWVVFFLSSPPPALILEKCKTIIIRN